MSNFGQQEQIRKVMSELGKRSAASHKKKYSPEELKVEMRRRGAKGLAKRWGKGNTKNDDNGRSETAKV